MNRNARIFCFLVLTLAALVGCSSKPSAQDSKKAETAPDKIQGKAQVLTESGGASDSALNAGGPSVYLWVGARRYRLFLRTATEIVHGDQYVAEGVYAQKAIDEIGDPDQGKNGYPLQTSCERVVTTAWRGLPFDAINSQAAVLRAIVKRYPARAVFLVAQIRPVTATESGAASAEPKKDAAAEEKNIKEVSVAADKQKALLMEGSPVQTAPLWEPEGGTVSCKVVIDPEGKISDLESTTQLCESVTWSQFRYQPPVQGGHPVKVKTEVEVRFEARK
jgi:Gram-negative bacterial tonB protein.